MSDAGTERSGVEASVGGSVAGRAERSEAGEKEEPGRASAGSGSWSDQATGAQPGTDREATPFKEKREAKPHRR